MQKGLEYQKNTRQKPKSNSSFNLGRSPYGETHYILVGVESFMEAFDVGKFRQSNKASMSAWGKFIESNQGNVEFVRSTIRVMMGMVNLEIYLDPPMRMGELHMIYVLL